MDYMRRLSGPVPGKARRLKEVPLDRRKKWIDLAEALSKRAPTESTKRTVRYLLWLAESRLDTDVTNFPRLTWHESGVVTPRVDLKAPSVLSKLCPAMHFRANLR